MQADIWQYYQTTHPGEVQLLGPDIWNGSQPQLRMFRTSTGATYPLLLSAGTATGGDLNALYGPNDNYVVINKSGIVRYNSIIYPHGERYRPDEIRATVDSLVSPPLDVPGASARGHELRSLPNPFRASTIVEFSNPGGSAVHARVTVHDLQGRRVATLWDGPTQTGLKRVSWDGRDARGATVSPGVYVLRGEVGGVMLSRRVTRLR